MKLSQSSFEETYRPIDNHISGSTTASLDGRMYETFGKEMEFIQSLLSDPIQKSKVWAVVSKKNAMILVPNSERKEQELVGFVVTEVEYPIATLIEVRLNTEEE